MKNLETLLSKLDKKKEVFFREYKSYCDELPSKRNTHRANDTIYKDVEVAINYSKFIAYDYTKITKTTIDSFVSHLVSKGTTFSKIKRFISFLFEKELISQKIYAKVMNIKSIKDELNNNKEKKARITSDKWEDLYSQLSGVKKFALWFMFNTGVRVNELVYLQLSDIHIDHTNREYYISIRKKPEIGFYPKTESSVRQIDLRKQEMEKVEEYLAIREEQNLNHDFLIYNIRSNRNKKDPYKKRILNTGTVETWINSVKVYDEIPKENSKCKVKLHDHMKYDPYDKKKRYAPYCCDVFPNAPSHKHLTPHICRHSYASNIYYTGKEKGIDLLDAVSRLLGHKNSQITFEYLGLSKQEQSKKNIEALEIAYED